MGTNTDFAVKTHKKLKKPEDYKVILLNDDWTTMEFVVTVLKMVFNKNDTEAERIMLDVHEKGRGIVGIYTCDIAKTKVNEVHMAADQYGYPLQCLMEPA